jgi:hypothetical protein
MIINTDDFQEVKSQIYSKGNQRKFYDKGYWYKIDNQNCYEGLAEEFVSLVCEGINNIACIDYKTVQLEYRDNIYTGCVSSNMYSLGVQFVSLKKLFKNNNIPLNIFIKDENIMHNIENVVKVTYKITGLDIFEYLSKLILLDTLIINEDRHSMNLGICMSGSNYLIAPCFDNGSSLFCTDWTYGKKKTLSENLERVKSSARPFSKFYDKQVEAVLSLGASQLELNRQYLKTLVNNYSNDLYSEEIINRVKSAFIQRVEYNQDKGVYVWR